MASKDQGISHVTGNTSSSSERMLALSLQQYGAIYNSNKVIQSSNSATNSFANFRFANLKVKKDTSSFFSSTNAVCGLRGNKNSKQSVPQNMKVRDIPPCVTAVGSQSNQASFICSNLDDYRLTFDSLGATGYFLPNSLGVDILTFFASNEFDTLKSILVRNIGPAFGTMGSQAAWDALPNGDKAFLQISSTGRPEILGAEIAAGNSPRGGRELGSLLAPLPVPFTTVGAEFTMLQKSKCCGNIYKPGDSIELIAPHTGSKIQIVIGLKTVDILEGTYTYPDGTLGPFKKGK